MEQQADLDCCKLILQAINKIVNVDKQCPNLQRIVTKVKKLNRKLTEDYIQEQLELAVRNGVFEKRPNDSYREVKVNKLYSYLTEDYTQEQLELAVGNGVIGKRFNDSYREVKKSKKLLTVNQSTNLVPVLTKIVKQLSFGVASCTCREIMLHLQKVFKVQCPKDFDLYGHIQNCLTKAVCKKQLKKDGKRYSYCEPNVTPMTKRRKGNPKTSDIEDVKETEDDLMDESSMFENSSMDIKDSDSLHLSEESKTNEMLANLDVNLSEKSKTNEMPANLVVNRSEESKINEMPANLDVKAEICIEINNQKNPEIQDAQCTNHEFKVNEIDSISDSAGKRKGIFEEDITDNRENDVHKNKSLCNLKRRCFNNLKEVLHSTLKGLEDLGAEVAVWIVVPNNSESSSFHQMGSQKMMEFMKNFPHIDTQLHKFFQKKFH